MTGFGRYLERGWLVLASGVAAAAVLTTLWVIRAPMDYVGDPPTTPQGETAVAGGTDFTLRGMATVDEIPQGSGEVETPLPGATYVGVLIDYESTDGAEASCLLYLLGNDRQWGSAYVYIVDSRYTSTCKDTSGTVMQFFEVPLSAVDEIRGVAVIGKGAKAVLAGEVKPQ